MKNNTLYLITEPDQLLLDFIKYLELETPIRFDNSTLSGKFIMVTSEIKELETTISMPAEFYSIEITNFPMKAVFRYCPCDYCNKIVSVQLFVNGRDHGYLNAKKVIKHFKKAVPDMTVYLTSKAEPITINNKMVDL